MSDLPVPFETRPVLAAATRPLWDGPEPGDQVLGQMWGIVRRHLFLISVVTLLAVGAALTYVLRATPIYEGLTTLRIEEKQPNLPDIYRAVGSGGEVVTEVEVLRSRSLVEDATRRLNLQVTLLAPKGVSRNDLLARVWVSDTVVPGLYVLRQTSPGLFTLQGPRGTSALRDVAPGRPVSSGGVAFELSPAAARHPQIQIGVQSLEVAVIRVRTAIAVGQGNREARVVSLSYRDTDRQLAWRVPNAIAERFIARRQDAQKAAARSTVAFLRIQLDTLARQLQTSERALRQFREQEQVVNPTIEGNSQVERLIQIQSERSALEAERGALADLLAEVDTSARHSPADESPYRRLLAFPTLLKSQASSDLLRNLTDVEDQRAKLLVRRTPEDPEVQALDGRARELEEQLRSVAATYLQGLTNQVQSEDLAIRAFGRQLSNVPRRELEFARLQRQPKVLEEMYSLLQTRLKEAEIAQAVEDPSVQIVDQAVAPLMPVWPRKKLIVVGSLMLGVLLGVTLAFLREYFDKSVHTRADVSNATGLPVLGLIPRIPHPGRRGAIIGQRREVPVEIEPVRTRRGAPSPPRMPLYTFLPRPEDADLPTPEDAVPPLSSTPEPDPWGPSLRAHTQRLAINGLGTAIAEAYGSLQTNLLYSQAGRPVRVVVFTSAEPGEGKTTSVVNLALSLTHRGSHVLLIDADLRRGTVHTVFEQAREPGFADVLQGKVSFERACRSIQVDEGGVLHYLTSGTLPSNPSGLLASPSVKSLLASLRDRYEMIIIDSPPVNMMTDAALLGSSADGVIVVARAGMTHSDALGFALEQLGHVGARVLGAVLNDIDFRRDVTYDAAYRYYNYGQYVKDSAD